MTIRSRPLRLIRGSGSDLDHLAGRMRKARSHARWRELALRHDELSGAAAWREREATSLYDHAEIRRRRDRLASALSKDEPREILFLLNEGVHGNMGGMGSRKLYLRSHVGTKKLVESYIDLLVRGLERVASADDAAIPEEEKLDFLRRAHLCYGRSALMLSGGAGLIYFHHGVVDELAEQDLLPTVLSGSSAGGWVCLQIAALDDEAIRSGHLARMRYPEVPRAGLGELIALVRGKPTKDHRAELIDAFCPDLTFQEAYEHTGRYVNVSIAAAEAHQKSRLLNAITSPNVTLRSAAMATSAVPGIVEPVQLEAKGPSGEVKAYLPGRRWVDGSMSQDLPARRLSRLFGVNHYVVSLINPAALPFVRPPELDRGELLRSLAEVRHAMIKEGFRLAGRAAERNLFGRLGALMEAAYGMVDQQYTGDVNLVLQRRDFAWRHVAFQFAEDAEIEGLILAGRRAVWPNVDLLRNSMRMSRKLDELLLRFEGLRTQAGEYHVR